MPVIEDRDPAPIPRPQDVWISTTSTPVEVWTTTSQAEWATSYTTETGFITSYTTTTDCNCDYEPTTTSSWCPTPIIVTPTTDVYPIVTTPSNVIVVDHHGHGLSPAAVGGIIVGAFFGVLLLLLLCICFFRITRGRRRYGSDTSSPSPHRRRKPPIVIIDPYPRRPAANLTFVGGGNYPGTRVMVTKTQKTFVRPPPTRQVRTIRETRRTEKIRIVDDDD